MGLNVVSSDRGIAPSEVDAADLAEVEVQFAALPGDDRRLEAFDERREILTTMADNLATASPAAVQQLVSLVVARVETRDRAVVGVEWTPQAAPFFAAQESASFWRPRRDSNPRRRP